MAIDLLQRLKGVQGLANRSLEELCAIPGIGPAKAAQLKAAVELGKRVLASPLSTGTRIGSSRDLFHHYYPVLRDLRHEVFKVLLLDAKHAIIQDAVVSEGSLTLSVVHPREVFNLAVRESAAAVILLHNHPSGDPEPSPEDRELTARLVAAGAVLGIRVLDHVVIGDGRYVSFADRGWLARERKWLEASGRGFGICGRVSRPSGRAPACRSGQGSRPRAVPDCVPESAPECRCASSFSSSA